MESLKFSCCWIEIIEIKKPNNTKQVPILCPLRKWHVQKRTCPIHVKKQHRCIAWSGHQHSNYLNDNMAHLLLDPFSSPQTVADDFNINTPRCAYCVPSFVFTKDNVIILRDVLNLNCPVFKYVFVNQQTMRNLLPNIRFLGKSVLFT
jgi:hypothetical protein